MGTPGIRKQAGCAGIKEVFDFQDRVAPVTADWACIVKVAALTRTAEQRNLISLGAAAFTAGVSQIRFDRLLEPLDREIRRVVLVSIADRAFENESPFSVVDD